MKTEIFDPTKNPDEPFRYVDVSAVSNELWKITTPAEHKGSGAPSRARKLVRADDAIFATVRPTLKRVALVPEDLDGQIVSTAFCVLRADPMLADPGFIYYSLLTDEFVDRVGNLQRGASYPAVTDSNVLDQEITVPPLPEQRAIAGVLAKIQAAVEVREKIVAALKELKAETMAKLFREGLRGESPKQTDIGEIPESWKVVPLGSCCEKPRYGYTESARHDPVGPKFLRITDIADYWVDWDSVPYCVCPEPAVEEFQLRPGDLVFARIGATTGKSYLITECPKAVFASYLIRLRAKPGLDPGYLSCFFESEAYWTQVRANKGNNLKGGMSASVLSKLLFPLPHLDEQKEIAGVLKGVEGQITSAVKKRDTVKSLFASMLHLLMTGQVRVTRKMIALQALADRAARRPKWSVTVDEKLLQEIVKRIVEAAAPEKIILFGSAVRGEMGPDSDLDLLVVKECDHPREMARLIRRSLADIEISKDILVVRPATLEKHRETIGYIYRPALREGKVIYAP